MDRLKVLLTRERIAKRIVELGARITRDFEGESVVLIGVLKGATIFLADLARELKLDATFDFIAVSSYGNSRERSDCAGVGGAGGVNMSASRLLSFCCVTISGTAWGV